MRGKVAGLALGAGLILVAAVYSFTPGRVLSTEGALSDSAAVSDATGYSEQAERLEADRDAADSRQVRYSTPPRPDRVFAPSLEGTDVDGRLAADASGHLIIDRHVRDFFDYFLNTAGERPPEEVLAEILRYARTYLPATAAEEARQLLDAYLGYKQAALAMMARPLDPAATGSPEALRSTLEDSFDALKALRRQHMPAEAVEAFFADEEAYASYTLERMRIQMDSSLSESERLAQMAALRERLPPEIRETEIQVTETAARHAEIQRLREQADSEAGLRQALASRRLPVAQIEQIVADYRADQAFEAAYQRYRVARDRVVGQVADMAERSSRLKQLRANFFTEPDQMTLAQLRDIEELEAY
ncbi:lipase secretion chaperone [Hahella sp. SMD15-11]|uniref:Lipase chaperone n=1 Tax=Thermohahella caldifontis TaxID=3142973 RepID=A0AB39UWX5_9GAMM